MSHFKRLLCSPSGDPYDIGGPIDDFCAHVSHELGIEFEWKGVAERFANSNFPTYRSTGRTSITLTEHASLDFSSKKKGKMMDFITNVIDDFLFRPMSSLFEEIPDACDLYDTTGNVVIHSSTIWNLDTPIWEVLYVGPDSLSVAPVDGRIGMIGLFWAIYTLRTEGIAEFSIKDEVDCSTMSPDAECALSFSSYFDRAKCRVVCLREEGYKYRIITITELCVALVGQVARGLIDPMLHSNTEFNIGMVNPNKLWSFLKGKSQLYGLYMTVCCSVDLSNATDCGSRLTITNMMDGFLFGIRHPYWSFLTFSFKLALSERKFIFEDGREVSHSSGMMMGEGLCGVYLNVMSGIIRTLGPQLAFRLPDYLPKRMNNEDADAYIMENKEFLQEFLDHIEPGVNRLSTSGGDDSIVFGPTSCSNALRILYRMCGLLPSENTWYDSKRYATFTEETALFCPVKRNWVFIDSIKSRAYQASGDDKYEDLIVSKFSLITKYAKYYMFKPEFSEKHALVVQVAESMIAKKPSWINRIKKHNIPVGLPTSLGGICHPMGVLYDYTKKISDPDKRVIKGLRLLDSVEAFLIMWDPTQSSDDEDLQSFRDIISSCFSDLPFSDEIVDDHDFIYDLSTFFPPTEESSYGEVEKQKDLFKRTHGLTSLLDYASNKLAEYSLRVSLVKRSDKSDRPKAFVRTINRLTYLREKFEHIELLPGDDEILSLWELNKHYKGRSKDIVFRESKIDSLIDHSMFPSLKVQIRA